MSCLGHTNAMDVKSGDDSATPGQPGTPGFVRPSHLTPHLAPVANADPEWVDIGRRYWNWHGFRPSASAKLGFDAAVWVETTAKIATDVGEPSGRIYVLAAAGVTAALPAFTCPTCGEPLTLRSRTALDHVARGGNPAEACAQCNSTLVSALRKLRDPAAAERRHQARLAARERNERHEAARAAARIRDEMAGRWTAICDAQVVARHPITVTGEESVVWALLDSAVRVEVGVLAMLEYAPAAAPIPPVADWPERLTPSADMTRDVLVATVRSGLLRVHGSASPRDAFAWSPAMQEAIDIAGGNPNALPEPVFEGWYPERVAWYAWQGGSVGTGSAVLTDRLVTRLADWQRTRQGQIELADLTRELIAGETRRYFQDQLDEHNLPDVPDNHESRLMEAMRSVAAQRPLGETYNLAWRAVRAGAASAQANPRAPLANMTTHAVNRFESFAQSATTDPTWEIKKFGQDKRVPLSALTRTVFLRLFGTDPMTTAVPLVRAGFPVPSRESLPIAGSKDVEDVVSAATAAGEHDRDYDPVENMQGTLHWLDARKGPLRVEALAEVLDDEPRAWLTEIRPTAGEAKALATAWQHLAGMLGTLRQLTGDDRSSALAVVAAAHLVDGTVTVVVSEPEQSDTTSKETIASLFTNLMVGILIATEEPTGI